LHNER